MLDSTTRSTKASALRVYGLLCVALASLALCLPTIVLACDFDGDGIADPATFADDASTGIRWQAMLSNGGALDTSFGSTTSIPAAGTYFTDSVAALGVVNPTTFFWTVQNPDLSTSELNFGAPEVSYMPGRDWNGDGVTDLGKFLNRCNSFRRRCSRELVTGNFLLNQTDGSVTFGTPLITATGFYGRGLDALWAMDADNDGDDDVCVARPNRKNPRVFAARCNDVMSGSLVRRTRLGRLTNVPLEVRTAEGTSILVWKARRRSGSTRLTLFPSQGSTSNFTIPALGTTNGGAPLVGDYLGTGSDQIIIVVDGVGTGVDPSNGATFSIAFPATGEPIDCRNRLFGEAETRILNSRNVCRVMDCTK